MGLFDRFKKKTAVDFESIDSIEKARIECKKKNLERMYVVSPMFGGAEDDSNVLFVPAGVNRIKEGYDDIIADLVEEGKVKSFDCKPEYKGKSVVPCKITIRSGKDGVDVFSQTINIW